MSQSTKLEMTVAVAMYERGELINNLLYRTNFLTPRRSNSRPFIFAYTVRSQYVVSVL